MYDIKFFFFYILFFYFINIYHSKSSPVPHRLWSFHCGNYDFIGSKDGEYYSDTTESYTETSPIICPPRKAYSSKTELVLKQNHDEDNLRFGTILIGGVNSNDEYFSDFFKYDNHNNDRFYWVGGLNSTFHNHLGVYDDEADHKIPRARCGAITGISNYKYYQYSNENHIKAYINPLYGFGFILFGGEVIPGEYLNDLWFIATGYSSVNTFLGGANKTMSETEYPISLYGQYGTMGESDSLNWPGGRAYGTMWSDVYIYDQNKNDIIHREYLYGGIGYDRVGDKGPLNDLWLVEFLDDNFIFTWIGGSDLAFNMGGLYNPPGLINFASDFSVMDQLDGDHFSVFYLFGGQRVGGFSNLFWCWINGTWTNLGGSFGDNDSIYTDYDIHDLTFWPSSRHSSVIITNKTPFSTNSIYLYGGYQYDGVILNDLWRYDEGMWAILSNEGSRPPYGRYGHVAFNINHYSITSEYFMICGGFTDFGLTDSCFRLDMGFLVHIQNISPNMTNHEFLEFLITTEESIGLIPNNPIVSVLGCAQILILDSRNDYKTLSSDSEFIISPDSRNCIKEIYVIDEHHRRVVIKPIFNIYDINEDRSPFVVSIAVNSFHAVSSEFFRYNIETPCSNCTIVFDPYPPILHFSLFDENNATNSLDKIIYIKADEPVHIDNINLISFIPFVQFNLIHLNSTDYLLVFASSNQSTFYDIIFNEGVMKDRFGNSNTDYNIINILQCNPLCATCYGPEESHCLSCDPPNFLINSTCYTNCPISGGCENYHCYNGVLDGNELNIDCGGDCHPCIDFHLVFNPKPFSNISILQTFDLRITANDHRPIIGGDVLLTVVRQDGTYMTDRYIFFANEFPVDNNTLIISLNHLIFNNYGSFYFINFPPYSILDSNHSSFTHDFFVYQFYTESCTSNTGIGDLENVEFFLQINFEFELYEVLEEQDKQLKKTEYISLLSSLLECNINRIEITEILIGDTDDTSILYIIFKHDDDDCRTSKDLFNILQNMLNDPNSPIYSTPDGEALDPQKILPDHNPFVPADWEFLIMIILIIAGSVLLVYFFFLIVGHFKKVKEHHPAAFVVAMLSIYDFLTDVLFVYSIKDINPPIYFYTGLTFIILPIIVNLISLIYFFVKCVSDNPAFSKWFEKVGTSFAFIAIISCTNLNAARLLNSNLLGLTLFSAPLDTHMFSFLITLSTLGHFTEDIPQLVLQFLVASRTPFNQWSDELVLTLLGTILTLVFGMINRIFYIIYYRKSKADKELTNKVNQVPNMLTAEKQSVSKPPSNSDRFEPIALTAFSPNLSSNSLPSMKTAYPTQHAPTYSDYYIPTTDSLSRSFKQNQKYNSQSIKNLTPIHRSNNSNEYPNY